MNKRIRIPFIALVIVAALALTPSNTFTLLRSVEVKGMSITTDNLKNAYVININNEVQKISSDGVTLHTHSGNTYGKLTSIDVTNPLELLLLYPNFSYVVILDKTLSFMREIDLKTIGVNRVGAICASSDHNIWVYDEQTYQIFKLDNTIRQSLAYENVDRAVEAGIGIASLLQSDDLSQLVSQAMQPNFMIEHGKWLYLNDPDYGIMVFDLYANYFKIIPIKGLKNFQIRHDMLYYFLDGKFFTYHLKTFETTEVDIPTSDDTEMVRIEKGRLYLLAKNRLDLYKY